MDDVLDSPPEPSRASPHSKAGSGSSNHRVCCILRRPRLRTSHYDSWLPNRLSRRTDAYSWLKREAAPGVDGRTWQSYKQNLEANLVELHSRIHRGTYRVLPSRRRYIPKSDGRQRPPGIAALEDINRLIGKWLKAGVMEEGELASLAAKSL
jgi:hypothetical protein